MKSPEQLEPTLNLAVAEVAAVVVAQFWKLAFRKEFWLKKYQAPISFQGPSS